MPVYVWGVKEMALYVLRVVLPRAPVSYRPIAMMNQQPHSWKEQFVLLVLGDVGSANNSRLCEDQVYAGVLEVEKVSQIERHQLDCRRL